MLRREIAGLETEGWLREGDRRAGERGHFSRGGAEEARTGQSRQECYDSTDGSCRGRAQGEKGSCGRAKGCEGAEGHRDGRQEHRFEDTSLRTAEALERRSAESARRRDDTRRRRDEINHARDVALASAPRAPVRYVEVTPPRPEQLRVLYLTANPDATETTVTSPDGSVVEQGTWLRVDQEVRQVKQGLRGSKYRDLVATRRVGDHKGRRRRTGNRPRIDRQLQATGRRPPRRTRRLRRRIVPMGST